MTYTHHLQTLLVSTSLIELAVSYRCYRSPKPHPLSEDGSSKILLPLFELSGYGFQSFWTICPVGVTASAITTSLHVVGVASTI